MLEIKYLLLYVLLKTNKQNVGKILNITQNTVIFECPKRTHIILLSFLFAIIECQLTNSNFLIWSWSTNIHS